MTTPVTEAIDPAALLQSAGWPAPVETTRVSGGWDTEIWRITLADRRRYALRVYRRHARATAAAQREAISLRALALGGVPVPQVEVTGEFDGRRYLLLAWLRGRPMLDLLDRPWNLWRLAVTLGRLQARIHTVPPPVALTSSPADAWVGDVSDPALAAAVREAATTATTCHGDFHPGNVMVANGVTGVIDFANVFVGDPRADLGITSAVLNAAPLPPGPLRPLLQGGRRLFARGWRAGYRARAGVMPLTPLFEAWGAAYYLAGLEGAIRDGRGWATPDDAARLRGYIARWTRAAGVG